MSIDAAILSEEGPIPRTRSSTVAGSRTAAHRRLFVAPAAVLPYGYRLNITGRLSRPMSSLVAPAFHFEASSSRARSLLGKFQVFSSFHAFISLRFSSHNHVTSFLHPSPSEHTYSETHSFSAGDRFCTHMNAIICICTRFGA
jgi:hypothetical protein